jgi:hypothetical protein
VTVVDSGSPLLLGGAVKVGMECRMLPEGLLLRVRFRFWGTGPALASNFVRLFVVVAVVVAVEDVDAEFPVVVLTVLTLGLDGPVDSELSHESSLPLG